MEKIFNGLSNPNLYKIVICLAIVAFVAYRIGIGVGTLFYRIILR